METGNLLVEMDGTYDCETKSIETTKEGDMIVAWGGGRGHPTGPTTSSWEGEVHYITQSPRLSWANNTSALVEGTWDRAAQECQVKYTGRSNLFQSQTGFFLQQSRAHALILV